ncbi:alpha-1A adrenergic receptor-like [Hydra vulgaris]|uniref:alpha-1A adrenergic receptor-like n=1 Tax=Hydra vulgaris TaxID=6087 RepID=UPI0032EA525E
MANIDNSEIHDSKVIIAIKSLYLFICFFLGVCGNSIVIIAIIKNKKLQTITNCFVLNLAITDLLFAVCEIPTIIFTTISKKWLLGRFVCDGVGFLNSLFCTTSIWTLVMISINRYFNVAKATQVKVFIQRKEQSTILKIFLVNRNTTNPEILNARENNKKRAIKKYFKEVRVTKMLMILVLCFFFCWTPVFVGSMLYSFNLDLKGFQVATFGIMCACLNCVLNPLIYSIMNRSFQKCVIQMWKTIALR